MSNEAINISLEFTPNPNTLKFVVNRKFCERGAANYTEASKAETSPLAQKLFEVKGVQGVMVGTHFVTITKGNEGDWDYVAEHIPKAIETHLALGAPVFAPGFDPAVSQAPAGGGDVSEIEKKIREVLDNEIRPAVAMDGGDITFGRYDDGIVYLQLQGSCSSCPSSVATLKMGVETRLKEVIPEIKEVVQM